MVNYDCRVFVLSKTTKNLKSIFLIQSSFFTISNEESNRQTDPFFIGTPQIRKLNFFLNSEYVCFLRNWFLILRPNVSNSKKCNYPVMMRSVASSYKSKCWNITCTNCCITRTIAGEIHQMENVTNSYV